MRINEWFSASVFWSHNLRFQPFSIYFQSIFKNIFLTYIHPLLGKRWLHWFCVFKTRCCVMLLNTIRNTVIRVCSISVDRQRNFSIVWHSKKPLRGWSLIRKLPISCILDFILNTYIVVVGGWQIPLVAVIGLILMVPCHQNCLQNKMYI